MLFCYFGFVFWTTSLKLDFLKFFTFINISWLSVGPNYSLFYYFFPVLSIFRKKKNVPESWIFFFFIGYNRTSHNLIVFKSVVWKKGDESFRKCHPGFGCGIEPRSSCTGVVCATMCAIPHPLSLNNLVECLIHIINCLLR